MVDRWAGRSVDIDAGDRVVAQGTGSVFTGDVNNNDAYKCILAATDDDGAQSTAVWTFYGMQFLPITSPDEPTVTANIRDTDPNTGSWNHTAIAGEDANFDIQSTLSGEGSPPAPTMVCYYTVDGTGLRHLQLSIDIWSLGPSSSPCRSDFRHRRLPPSGTDIRRSSGTGSNAVLDEGRQSVWGTPGQRHDGDGHNPPPRPPRGHSKQRPQWHPGRFQREELAGRKSPRASTSP